jgi:hypothetical protein
MGSAQNAGSLATYNTIASTAWGVPCGVRKSQRPKSGPLLGLCSTALLCSALQEHVYTCIIWMACDVGEVRSTCT